MLGVEQFLTGLREELRTGSFRPDAVKQRAIPKRGGKLRYLGIATVRDRVVQAALKLVLEPIFEVDFEPCSYGFRPDAELGRDRRGALLTSRSYEWIVEADIQACFDELSHSAILGRVRRRVADKRVLGLIKAFLKAGSWPGRPRETLLDPRQTLAAAIGQRRAARWISTTPARGGDRSEVASARRDPSTRQATYRLTRTPMTSSSTSPGATPAKPLVAQTEQ